MHYSQLTKIFELYANYATIFCFSNQEYIKINLFNLLNKTIAWIFYDTNDESVLFADDFFSYHNSEEHLDNALQLLNSYDIVVSNNLMKFNSFIKTFVTYSDDFLNCIDFNITDIGNKNNSTLAFLSYISIMSQTEFIELCQENNITDDNIKVFLKFYDFNNTKNQIDSFLVMKAILAYIICHQINYIDN